MLAHEDHRRAEVAYSGDEAPGSIVVDVYARKLYWVLPDGRALIQYIYDTRFEGADEAERLLKDWENLEGLIPSDSYLHTLERFRRQLLNAREWRDVLNNYFRRFSGAADEKGREVY